jgi:ankyrin repeat protein
MQVPSLHQTPLHIAAEAGDVEMVQLLLGRGATLDLRDASGSTPLHLALEAQVGRRECGNCLERAF